MANDYEEKPMSIDKLFTPDLWAQYGGVVPHAIKDQRILRSHNRHAGKLTYKGILSAEIGATGQMPFAIGQTLAEIKQSEEAFDPRELNFNGSLYLPSGHLHFIGQIDPENFANLRTYIAEDYEGESHAAEAKKLGLLAEMPLIISLDWKATDELYRGSWRLGPEVWEKEEDALTSETATQLMSGSFMMGPYH